jgi:hypothetical protein
MGRQAAAPTRRLSSTRRHEVISVGKPALEAACLRALRGDVEPGARGGGHGVPFLPGQFDARTTAAGNGAAAGRATWCARVACLRRLRVRIRLQSVSRARGTPTRMPRDSEVPADCSNLATEDRGHPPFRVICFAQTKRLWCNSDNFPKGGWPGVRWEHRSASHGEPFAPEPYV